MNFKSIIMRFSFFFAICFFAVCLVTAGDVLSQEKKEVNIHLSATDATVVSVIESISQQSGYKFFYDGAILSQMERITIQMENATLQQVFDRLHKQTKLEFRKVGNTYTVIPPPLPAKQEKTEAKQQQGIQVTGTVSDNYGEVLPGVSVVVRGTTIGINTDANGEFSLTVPSDTSVLIFSYIGYKMQEVTVGNRRIIAITMLDDVTELSEVTVVAFGVQKKESVIASVTTVNPSDLQIPSSNLTTAFAGRLAGVISYQRTGEPGQDNAEFFIRGVTSFGTGKKDPLILIDNVEMTTEDLSRLTVDDIAAFSIMKDANATALYGARGANGVILVSTKEGRQGKAKVQLRMEGSFSQPTQNIELVDPVNFMKYHNDAVYSRTPGRQLPYDPRKVELTEMGIDPIFYPANDWQELLFNKNTFNQRYNLNVSGGGTVARYYIAAMYSKDQGIIKNDSRNSFSNNIDIRKYSLRANVNVNLTKYTEVIVRLNGVFDDYVGPIDGGTDLYNKAINSNPVYFLPYYEPDEANKFTNHILYGNYGNGDYLNPYAEMTKGYRTTDRSNMYAQFEAKQNLEFLLKGLSARALFNVNRYSQLSITRRILPFFYLLNPHTSFNDDSYVLTCINPETGRDFLDYEPSTREVTSTMYFEGALMYNETFAAKHGVSGLLVYTAREEKIGLGSTLQLALPYRNLGLAGRFTYSYDNRYFIEGNFGYNGSERFHSDNRWGFFPSAGAGWIVSNERFMESIKSVVSKLKLKATYGLVGNDAIGSSSDRFFYMSELNMSDANRRFIKGNDFTAINGISIIRYSNPTISWEISHKSNYGIELNLWNNTEIQVDYFREKRENILQSRADIPTTMGLQAVQMANLGKANGSGFEVSLDYNKSFSKDLWVIFRGNFTYASSKYDFYEEPSYINAPWRRRTGRKLNQRFGYVAERLFVDDEEAAAASTQSFGDYAAGDIKYKDINGDLRIDLNDQVPIGYPTVPEVIYGFGLSAGYKGFDFSCFFQGSARSSFWIDPAATAPFVPDSRWAGTTRSMLQYYADSHWSEDNQDLYALWPRLSATAMPNNNQVSTWFMRNGSFLRLKTAEVGYTLPRNKVQQVKLETVRLYVSGSNLAIWSAFKLWDPEMAGNGLAYPLQRVLNVGINVEF